MHSLSEFVVISQSNKVYVVFNLFDRILCMISTYVYAYISAFRLHSHISKQIFNTYIFFEIVFFISMISRFFVEFTQSSNGVPCRELKMIVVNYLKGDFKIDFICILPLQMIPLKNNRNYLFFIIKMVRFLRGLELFDVQKIMQFFKRLSQEYIQDMVDTNWNLANSKLHDNSKIVSLLILSYFLRTLKLVVIITNVSYFLGIFWYIYCEA